jgi:hypothetical protein
MLVKVANEVVLFFFILFVLIWISIELIVLQISKHNKGSSYITFDKCYIIYG